MSKWQQIKDTLYNVLYAKPMIWLPVQPMHYIKSPIRKCYTKAKSKLWYKRKFLD